MLLLLIIKKLILLLLLLLSVCLASIILFGATGIGLTQNQRALGSLHHGDTRVSIICFIIAAWPANDWVKFLFVWLSVDAAYAAYGLTVLLMNWLALWLLAGILIRCITISVDTISDVSECLLSNLFLFYLFKHFIYIKELFRLLPLLIECNITIPWCITTIHIGSCWWIIRAHEAFIDGWLIFHKECIEIIHLYFHSLQWFSNNLINEALCYWLFLFLLWIHIVFALNVIVIIIMFWWQWIDRLLFALLLLSA